ncbi:hypothetical protein [Marinoscillum furvescens]|nr:hypothetical protein [Marinoscillum furvescens]
MRTLTFFTVWITCLALGCGEKKTESELTFDLKGKSHLYLINHTNDSLDLRIRDNAIWPEKNYYDVKVLAPKVTQLEIRKTQGRNDFYLSVEGETYNLYAYPGSRDTVIISGAKSGDLVVDFAGDLQVVNQFLKQKSTHFGAYHSDREGRSKFMIDGSKALEDIYAYNDSITAVQKTFLNTHQSSIPNWYVQFELKRLDYLNTWYKVNALIYRTKTLKQEGVSSELIAAPYKGLLILKKELLGNRDYMSFLDQYITHQIEFEAVDAQPFKTRKEELAYRLSVIEKRLKGEVKEAYLTRELSQYIDRGILYDSAWLAKVNNPKYSDFIGGVKSYYLKEH